MTFTSWTLADFTEFHYSTAEDSYSTVLSQSLAIVLHLRTGALISAPSKSLSLLCRHWRTMFRSASSLAYFVLEGFFFKDLTGDNLIVRGQEFGGCDHNVHPKLLMASFFYDGQGVTVVNLLPRGTTVNSTATLRH